jgi:hypothetical protein
MLLFLFLLACLLQVAGLLQAAGMFRLPGIPARGLLCAGASTMLLPAAHDHDFLLGIGQFAALALALTWAASMEQRRAQRAASSEAESGQEAERP